MGLEMVWHSPAGAGQPMRPGPGAKTKHPTSSPRPARRGRAVLGRAHAPRHGAWRGGASLGGVSERKQMSPHTFLNATHSTRLTEWSHLDRLTYFPSPRPTRVMHNGTSKEDGRHSVLGWASENYSFAATTFHCGDNGELGASSHRHLPAFQSSPPPSPPLCRPPLDSGGPPRPTAADSLLSSGPRHARQSTHVKATNKGVACTGVQYADCFM